MSCDLDYSVSVLHSYFDGELSFVRAAEFRNHLGHCSECVEDLASLSSVRDLLTYAGLHEPAPASLGRRIRAEIHSSLLPSGTSLPLAWRGLAAAAALLFVAFILWRVIPGARKEEDYQAEFAAGIVDAHLRSLLPGQMTEVSSADPQTVRAWFDDQVKFAFPVRDFANNGFALQGGRVDIVQGRTVAAIVYRSHEQLFNVFLWRTPEFDGAPRAGSRQGYQWIDWRRKKLEFCAVSDAAPADLARLERLLTE